MFQAMHIDSSQDEQSDLFYQLTPALAVELAQRAGLRCDGLCMALNSYENRVFELGLESSSSLPFPNSMLAFDSQRVIVKFYRPKRFSQAQILEEHQALQELADNDLPVAPALMMSQGQTLACVEGIYAAVFPKIKGRPLEEVMPANIPQLGRLIARMHQVLEHRRFVYRSTLSVANMGDASLDILLQKGAIPPAIEQAYVDTCEALFDTLEQRLQGVPMVRTHGDCHRGNILQVKTQSSGMLTFYLVDFDDAMNAPLIQDLWLLNPGQGEEALDMQHGLIQGYEQIKPFPHAQLPLIELLRALRVVHYSAWIAKRIHDPAFVRMFESFHEPRYFEDELNFLREIRLRLS